MLSSEEMESATCVQNLDKANTRGKSMNLSGSSSYG